MDFDQDPVHRSRGFILEMVTTNINYSEVTTIIFTPLLNPLVACDQVGDWRSMIGEEKRFRMIDTGQENNIKEAVDFVLEFYDARCWPH